MNHHLQASATVLNKLKEREEAKHKAAMLKNELESYIISIRSKVNYGPKQDVSGRFACCLRRQPAYELQDSRPAVL